MRPRIGTKIQSIPFVALLRPVAVVRLATRDIARRISDARALKTRELVEATHGIPQHVGREEVAGLMTAILTTATREIARSVQKAADGTTRLADSVTGVRTAAGETAGAAGGVLGVARTIGTQSAEIEAQVQAFVLALRQGSMDRRKGRDGAYQGIERRVERIAA